MPESRSLKPPNSGSLLDPRGALAWIETWRAELIIAFVLLWIAYGFLGFSLSTAGDDWVALSDDSVLVRYALENGRWLHAVLMIAQDHSRVAPTFSLAMLLAAILAATAMFANALQLRRPGTVVLFVVLAGCFPFWAEFASFRILHLPGAMALLLSCAYGYLVWRTAGDWVDARSPQRLARILLAGLLFSLCAATYQGFLPIGVMLLGCYFIGVVAAEQPEPGRLGLRLSVLAMLVFVVGVSFYAMQVSLSRVITGVGASTEPTYQLASSLVGSVDDLQLTVSRLGRYLWAFYAQPNHLFPLWPKVLFAPVLLVFVVRILFGRDFRSLASRGWMLGVTSVLVLAPWALGLIRVPDPYRYNAIVSAGLIYAVVICFTLDRTTGKRGRTVLAGVGMAIALCFVFMQNSASHITHQANLRDMAVVNRLLDRLTLADGYSQLGHHAPVNVVLSGEFQVPAHRPFHSGMVDSVLQSSIIDCDILRCQPARLDWATPLVSSDTVRYRFVRLLDQSPAYQAVLRPVVAELAQWPASGSLVVVDDTTVVVRLPERKPNANRPSLPLSNSAAQVGLVPVTSSGDGFVLMRDGAGAFSVSVSNFDTAATYRLTAEATGQHSEAQIGVCETEPKTGGCTRQPVDAGTGMRVELATRQNATVAIFVSAVDTIERDVLRNRVVVRLADADGYVRATTSVAVASERE